MELRQRLWFLHTMANNRFLWIAAMIYAASGAVSTWTTFTDPNDPALALVPHLRWYWWVIGWLILALAAVFEGGLKYARLAHPGFIDSLARHNSAVLFGLPAYPQDLTVTLLACRKGTMLCAPMTYFMHLAVTSDFDAGIGEIIINCRIAGGEYEVKPLNDLSEWVIRSHDDDPQHPYRTFRDEAGEDVSLLRDLRQNGLKSGLEKRGWIGFTIKDAKPQDFPEKIMLAITKSQVRTPYRFWFFDFEDGQNPVAYDRVFTQTS